MKFLVLKVDLYQLKFRLPKFNEFSVPAGQLWISLQNARFLLMSTILLWKRLQIGA